MIPIEGRPVVTAAQMRAAEAAAMTGGATVETLMARAGEGVAAALRRLVADGETLILCGPGNNGGDGYVAAAALRRTGMPVRVAASADPATDAARRARALWDGPVEPVESAVPAPVLVDALFGTGLSRALDPALGEALARLRRAARFAVAVDLPSGVDSDSGALLGEVPPFDLTLALGAPKPAHLLQPAAARCGAVRVVDIGVAAESDARVLARPALPRPGPDSHKYSRGMVAVVGGGMAGAGLLAATAAMHAGAGYVLLLGEREGGPHALVHKRFSDHALADPRIGAIVIGPGLGRDDDAQARLDAALATDRPLVVDGDALRLLDLDRLSARSAPAILTPHAGEFDHLFGKGEGSKLDRARDAAARSRAVVVFKGPDTVIATPDGRARIAGEANAWLSTAGTGDVLAGAIGAALAVGLDPLDAAAAGVWLHADAASRLGAAFVADDLAAALARVRASL